MSLVSIKDWIAGRYGESGPAAKTVRNWCNAGRFGDSAIMEGGRWRIKSDAVPRWPERDAVVARDTKNAKANKLVAQAMSRMQL